MGMWYRSTGYLSTGYLTVGDVIVIYIKVWVCNHWVFKSMGMEIQPRKCRGSKYRVPKYIESFCIVTETELQLFIYFLN